MPPRSTRAPRKRPEDYTRAVAYARTATRLAPFERSYVNTLGVALFRAARELLFNVVKHAHVPSARIDVSRSADGRVQVVVRDDGVGFDPESVMAGSGTEGGFGLLSVRDHLDLLGGQLDVDSSPGCGTSIRILGPVPRTPATGSAAPAGRVGGQPQAANRARLATPRRSKRTSKR